jgi:hypothetical protein
MIIGFFFSHSAEQGTPLMPSLGEFYVKCMLTVFFDTHAVMYYESVPERQIVYEH